MRKLAEDRRNWRKFVHPHKSSQRSHVQKFILQSSNAGEWETWEGSSNSTFKTCIDVVGLHAVEHLLRYLQGLDGEGFRLVCHHCVASLAVHIVAVEDNILSPLKDTSRLGLHNSVEVNLCPVPKYLSAPCYSNSMMSENNHLSLQLNTFAASLTSEASTHYVSRNTGTPMSRLRYRLWRRTPPRDVTILVTN